MTSHRLSAAAVASLVLGLGERDRSILLDLARVRVLTGAQVTRLHFHNLSPKTQDRVRRRILSRLISLNLVATLERPIGGARAGSAGLIYALDAGGQRAIPLILADDGSEPPNRPRKPWTPGRTFLRHTLDIAELYVQLVEAGRAGILRLEKFFAEPASWFPNGVGGVVKPDAYVSVGYGDVTDIWAIEVDRATESLPTIRHKLMSYVDFAVSGQLGPDGVAPRVLITAPHERRLSALTDLVARLPDPASQLLSVVGFTGAVHYMAHALKE